MCSLGSLDSSRGRMPSFSRRRAMAPEKSPAMLVYLDNFQSTSPDAQLPQNRRPGQLQGRPPLFGGGFGNPRLNRQQQIEREMQRDQMRNPNQNPQNPQQQQAKK